MNTKAAYEKLIEEIHKYDRYYFEEAKPLIADYTYDQLVKQVEAIEKEHPDWISSQSPTQRVGIAISKGFKQRVHKVPMLSLANTYSREEVEDFVKRVHKLLGDQKVTFCAELKMDGVAISVCYRENFYSHAVTRGDGRKGDDVTANLKTSLSLPLMLDKAPEEIEVRGEVFMPLSIFQEQNKRWEEAGKEVWANPRNAAAGSLKLLDSREVSKRRLSVVFYGIADEEQAAVATQIEVHDYLGKLGLPIFSRNHRHLCHNVDDIFQFAEKIEKERVSLPFEIDGIVIKVNELKYHSLLGFTGKSPRFAIAYKFAPEQALTQIQAITVQVGRTGVITPVAELEPIVVAGSKISRASLHNQEEIERKDIRVGDWVIIEKGGDVIPKVVEVRKSQRPEGAIPWKMPESCPGCGSQLIHSSGEVSIRCPNVHCLQKRMRQIAYFASKEVMDIGNMGERVVEQLVDKGLVTTLSDIYTLREEDLAQLDGFKEKSIKNLLDSIQASRRVTLPRLILGLGIKHVGKGIAELLAKQANDIEVLANMTKEELLEIEGVGDKVAEAIVEYFNGPQHRQELHLLLQYIILEKPRAPYRKDSFFYGKTFVLTGTLHSLTRLQTTELIQERGGKVSSSVSQKSDYLVAGDEAGSKLDKAEQLGIKILSESDFIKLLD